MQPAHKITSVYIPPILQRRWNRRKAAASAYTAAGIVFVIATMTFMLTKWFGGI